MTVKDLLETKKFNLENEGVNLENPIEDVYIGDLLSWVMSHANKKCAWITVQTHMNIVAVAVLLEMSCIILPEDLKPDENTTKKALEEDIPIFSTSLNAYEIACLFKDMM